MDLTPLRITVGTMLGVVPFLALALSFVLVSSDPEPGPPVGSPWGAYLGLVAYGVVVHLLNRTIGSRVGSRPQAVELAAFVRASTMLRASLSESVVFFGVAAAFVVETDGYTVFLVSAVVTVALFAVDVWPTRRQVRRCEEALVRARGSSYPGSPLPS
ncbi:hypothetical protein [Nocardioides litoris]|uniref:hypothetical protein n=1 Tax=Nocardioides litoris TaxID=1926648 RepID=UPI0011217627|nr:hypothetical protein [Nocardioides litoris]